MTSQSSRRRHGVATLIGDAALFTALTVAIAPLTVVVGPAVAWLLHGRRIGRAAVIGWAIGVVVAVVGVTSLYWALVLTGAAIGLAGGSEFTGGIVLLVVATVVFFAVVIWLDADAIRDLAVARRLHARLDVARLVATAIAVLAAVAITLIQTYNPASGVGDAGPFALLAAAIGAVTVLVADLVAARLERADAVPGASGGA
jgi:hypothetical protein